MRSPEKARENERECHLSVSTILAEFIANWNNNTQWVSLKQKKGKSGGIGCKNSIVRMLNFN